MRILLAEDEQSLAKAVVTILRKNEFEAEAVFNGGEALKELETGKYDAAILDIMMPVMDGITVLQSLRRSGNPIPVLLLTARSEVEDKVLGFECGANDYLAKPFNSRELLARLKAMTGQFSPVDARLQMGNIQLDRRTFELSSPYGSFRLTNQEFQMLELLMLSRGHEITAERLREKIWHDVMTEEQRTAHSVEHTVQIYCSYLNRKLSALHADIVICPSENFASCLLAEKPSDRKETEAAIRQEAGEAQL